MLTDDEIQLATYALALRVEEPDREQWFAVADDTFTAAHAAVFASLVAATGRHHALDVLDLCAGAAVEADRAAWT